MADNCYRPATQPHPGHDRGGTRTTTKPFRLAFGLSGTLLMQAQRHGRRTCSIFGKSLADTGLVEFTGETYFHSLAGLFDDARVPSSGRRR